MKSKEENKVHTGRIASMDQFRGFAIFGMILVNRIRRLDQ